ncbi:MAG: succinate dehydrogenase, cytochrome b556 subunit [Methylotenera sp.]|jgi:succinate dehydrogenase cytochrome b subunit
MSEYMKNNRPKNLNLFTIRLPINALVSILHRVSGMALFAMLPFLLFLMHSSLSSEDGFNLAVDVLDFWLMKLILIGLAWAFFHHFYAGLRHLAQDLHWMHGLNQARYSSKIIMGLVALSVIYFAILIW